MIDPLDLTVPDPNEPLVELDWHGLQIPSPEVEPPPIWRTAAELAEGRELIKQIEADIPELDKKLDEDLRAAG